MSDQPSGPPSTNPAPTPPTPPVTADPNAIIVAAMVQNFANAITQPERVKAEEETKRTQIIAGVAHRSITCATWLLVVILGLAGYAFWSGERGLLREAFIGVFGFLAGLGFSRFFGPQKF